MRILAFLEVLVFPRICGTFSLDPKKRNNMRRLQKRDGTNRHLRHARYHISFCKHRQNDAFFLQLAQEMEASRSTLVTRVRHVEDAEDRLTARSADVSFAELSLEDIIRDILGETERLDRQAPELNMRQKTFPEGLNGVINPEGESQVKPAEELKRRLQDFVSNPAVPPLIAKLEESLSVFQAALAARQKEEKETEDSLSAEQSARTAVREQLEVSYGRLRERFKAKPKLTERYFYQEKSAEKSENKSEDPGQADGKITAIFLVLLARKVALTEEQSNKLKAPTDAATLDRWITNAATATKADDVFS